MISLILYGRNDSYGYNLHKHAALSLNCLSEVLTEPGDELIFVDYNTPDDFPTFPEAIQNTLTEHAKKRLRILRVRPSLHARFQKKTHLLALEPIARNIAIRRSNPESRWILPTNTDMIFVPHKGASLSAPLKELPPGFYHLPRFELPETLWEAFDRKDAERTIDSIRYWARIAHLNEIVEASPFILYDGPGDFQLVQRSDLFRIHGFDEDMLRGWHVDSNLAKRLNILHGETGSALPYLFGYHCGHTRQVTPVHRGDSVSNSIDVFVDSVSCAEKASQATTWGCPDDPIEEIRLSEMRNGIFLNGLRSTIKGQMEAPTSVAYVTDTFNKTKFDPRHVLPFVADILVNAAPGTSIGWLGANEQMFRLFCDLWSTLGISDCILLSEEPGMAIAKLPPNARMASFDELVCSANVFVVDYSVAGDLLFEGSQRSDGDEELLSHVKSLFLELVQEENRSLAAGQTPRRFICVNAIHNSFEALAVSLLAIARAPFSSRIRQGFVVPQANGPLDWTKKMFAGVAGATTADGMIAASGTMGHVMYGPYLVLHQGRYRASATLRFSEPGWRRKLRHPLAYVVLDVVAGSRLLAKRLFFCHVISNSPLELEFCVSRLLFSKSDANGLEFRLWYSGGSPFIIEKVAICASED